MLIYFNLQAIYLLELFKDSWIIQNIINITIFFFFNLFSSCPSTVGLRPSPSNNIPSFSLAKEIQKLSSARVQKTRKYVVHHIALIFFNSFSSLLLTFCPQTSVQIKTAFFSVGSENCSENKKICCLLSCVDLLNFFVISASNMLSTILRPQTAVQIKTFKNFNIRQNRNCKFLLAI